MSGRLVTLALLALVAVPTEARAEVLLSGGFTGGVSTLSPGLAGVPDWRIGGGAGRAVIWGNATFAEFTFDGDGLSELSGWLLTPRVGLRLDFADRKAEDVVGYGAGAVYTRLGGFDDGDDDNDPNIEPHFLGGGTLGGGLDVRVVEHLSLSAELGGDVFWAQYANEDTDVVASATTFGLYATVYVNIWL